jgi:hypothetical protein
MTTEQFTKILPCYIGQEYIHTGMPEDIRTLTGLKFGKGIIWAYFKNSSPDEMHGWADFYKLLLRPLSDMTEGEAKAVVKLLFPNYSMATGYKEFLLHAIQRFEFKFYEIVKIINELRAIGIDCDQLIESNYALDKTKMR